MEKNEKCMKKNSSRDEFPVKVKRMVAERVNFLCSICRCLTAAASDESNISVIKIGQAAHICAAAPGGPRYDASMTSEERKDINNCIWLCNNHAKMIDMDVITYQKEYLVEKKKETEDSVRLALLEGNKHFEIVQNNGFNIEKIIEILRETIIKGEYLKLKNLLDSLNKNASSIEMRDLCDYHDFLL